MPHSKNKCPQYRSKQSRVSQKFLASERGARYREECSQRMRDKWAAAKAAGARDLYQKKPGGMRQAVAAQVNRRFASGCWLYVIGLDRFEGMYKVGVAGDRVGLRIRQLMRCYPPDASWEAGRVWIKRKPGDVEARLLCDFEAEGEVRGEWARSSLRQLLCRVRELRPSARWRLTAAGVLRLVEEHQSRQGLPSTTSSLAA